MAKDVKQVLNVFINHVYFFLSIFIFICFFFRVYFF